MISFDKEFSASLKKLAVPIMLQSLLSTAIGTADTLMLSAVGQTELSAVSLANQWSFILNLFFTGLVGGTGIMLAQYMEGKKRSSSPMFSAWRSGQLPPSVSFLADWLFFFRKGSWESSQMTIC